MKRMLFIQGGSRWKFDTEGNIYTDSNFNEIVWDRYRGYCDHLTVILRMEEKVYEPIDAGRRFNAFNKEKSDYVALPDLYRPARNCVNFSYRRLVKREIDREVRKADLIVVRLTSGDVYATIAVKCAKKHNKPYLVEVTGFTFEQMWYHSLRGKLVAIAKETRMRSLIKAAPYAVYVTEKALQIRYPCQGETLACTDVELAELTDGILDNRLKKINSTKDKMVLGTAASLNVQLKGQEYVIRALAILKKQGITNIEYQLVGEGNGNKFRQLSQKLGVKDEVRIIGALSHDQIFTWIDNIDVYIQPSLCEGLCRSIVEAMSRSCPVIASHVGGNVELITQDCLFPRQNVKAIVQRIMYLSDTKKQTEQALRNYYWIKEHMSKTDLDDKRNQFYFKFSTESQRK